MSQDPSLSPTRPPRLRLLALIALVCTLTASLAVTLSLPSSAAPTTFSLWSDSDVPNTPADPERTTVELGTRFTSSMAGSVLAVRFYKSAQNTGPHTGSLWDSTGRRLASVTFSGETRQGWQRAEFARPVSIKAGATYVVSYSSEGSYADDQNYFAAGATRSSGPLRATAGVYSYDSSYPVNQWRSSNYFVDVVFAPSGATAPPSTTSTSATTAPTATQTTTSPTTSTSSTRPATSSTTTTTAPSPTTTSSPPSPTPSTGPAAWPDASNTGVVGCPTLKQVRSGGQVQINADGQTYENVEFTDPTVITVHAQNVTVRCVKFNGTGWFGIDNTDRPSSIVVDRVDINCQDKGQVIGMLLQNAVITRANVHGCDHMLNIGGNNVTIRDSYCHALTDLPVVHADCIQSLGGNTNLLIEHNSLWSRDTSDILLGQEGGEARNVVINNNRLMSEGSPPPAYLLYLTGTNTVVTNNRFTHRFTYGHCTHNNSYAYTWSGNVWDDTGQPIPSC